MWAVASQALWQHGPGVLCLLLAMLGLSWEQQDWRARVFTGFWLGFAFAVRPQTAPFLVAGAAAEWLITEGPNRAKRAAVATFCLGAFPLVAFTLGYNSYFFGSLFGSYHGYESGFRLSLLAKGGPALLLSPNRGLLFFTPIALLGLLGMAIALRRPRSHPIEATFAAVAIAYFVLHSSFFTWAGGWTFGPRYLIETLPALALASTLAIPRIPPKRAVTVAIVLAIGWSVLVEVNGAFCYPASNWNARMARDMEGHAWDFRHIELWEDFQVWRGKAIKADAIVVITPSATAKEPVLISTTTPVAIPGAAISVAPVVDSRLFVIASFDVAYESGPASAFVGKLRINNSERLAQAICAPKEPGVRMTVQQAWSVDVPGGHSYDLCLWGQSNGAGTKYRVWSQNTTLSVLAQPLTPVQASTRR